MSADSEPNYPDVLGYITGGPRVRIGVLQLAVAVHPRITRAGRPFEVMVLIQNASDVELEVVVSLTFPERDAKKQKNRFVSKAARLVIGLEAAEVGVAVLPVSSLPDTAPSDSYSITMDVKVRPSGSEKPNRIREANGGGALDLDDLEAAAQAKLPELRNVQWDTRSSLIGSSLSVPFTVMSGKVGQFADLKPSWTRLWSLSDLVDQVLLFNKHKESLAKMLPKLTRAPVYTQLVESTRRQFSESGVVLKPLEEQLIAKILTVILEYARLSPKDIRYLVGEDYSIQRYLEVDELRPAPKSVALPAWAQDLLRALNRDERVVEYPVRAIGHFSYAGLLKDAMQHTFDRIQAITDLDMGTAKEREHYIEDFVARMSAGTLDLSTLYMPLLIGGIIVSDEILVNDEQPLDLLDPMLELMEQRREELSQGHEDVYELAWQFADRLVKKYRMNQW